MTAAVPRDRPPFGLVAFVATSFALSLAWPFITQDPTAIVTGVVNWVLLWALWRGSIAAWGLFIATTIVGAMLNIVTGGPPWITVLAATSFVMLILPSTAGWVRHTPS